MQCKSLNYFYIVLVLEIKYGMKHFPMKTFFPYELISLLESHQQADFGFFPISISEIVVFSKESQNKTIKFQKSVLDVRTSFHMF